MPHYIWQSNLLFIISVERAKKENATSPFIATKLKGSYFYFYQCPVCVSFLDLPKLQLMNSTARSDTDAGFEGQKCHPPLRQLFIVFP